VPLNWGAIAVGGIAGLGAGVVLAIPVIAAMGSGGFGAQALLILVGFAGQLIAGFTGGRFAGRTQAAHGGLAALAVYLVTAAIAIASGADPGVGTLLFSGVVALVLGSAGGILAVGRRGHS
jgi:hypothetical protein